MHFMSDLSSLTSRELRNELGRAEEKYQQLCQRRDELNQKAKLLREERDMLNEEKKKLIEEMKEAKKKRDEIVAKMKEHKKRRGEFQQQAKELINKKRKQRGKFKSDSLFLKAEELKLEIRRLEYEQETVPMTPKEEERIINEIKEKKKEYERLKAEVDKQKSVEIDLENLDNAINQLFELADKEHEMVIKYYKESQEYHNKFVKLVDEISKLINEANEKHKEYLELKKRADEYHRKAVEMRGKILAIRKERKDRYEKAMKLIEEVNIKARRALSDEEIDKFIEQNMEKLKKQGKISIGL